MGRLGCVLAAPAVRSSQAQVHVTNFDYNHPPLNTMPDTWLTIRARSAARSRVRGHRQPVDFALRATPIIAELDGRQPGSATNLRADAGTSDRRAARPARRCRR